VPRGKRESGGGWNASQVVAHNLTRARELRGLTQAEIAERMTRFTGASWTAVTVAQAEGSVSGNRLRQFTANELVALARTFDLPVLYFFMPPEDGEGEFRTPDYAARGWPWEYLLVLLWGHSGNFPFLADRAAPWANASTVLVPPDDLLDPGPENPLIRQMRRSREALRPEDILAVAFNGMVRRRVRGAIGPGDALEVMISNLRRLADALEAFDNYPPSAFFDTPSLREFARRRQPPDPEETP
jgi:transcriptional regulator with XRE-family HTH domain